MRWGSGRTPHFTGWQPVAFNTFRRGLPLRVQVLVMPSSDEYMSHKRVSVQKLKGLDLPWVDITNAITYVINSGSLNVTVAVLRVMFCDLLNDECDDEEHLRAETVEEFDGVKNRQIVELRIPESLAQHADAMAGIVWDVMHDDIDSVRVVVPKILRGHGEA